MGSWVLEYHDGKTNAHLVQKHVYMPNTHKYHQTHTQDNTYALYNPGYEVEMLPDIKKIYSNYNMIKLYLLCMMHLVIAGVNIVNLQYIIDCSADCKQSRLSNVIKYGNLGFVICTVMN